MNIKCWVMSGWILAALGGGIGDARALCPVWEPSPDNVDRIGAAAAVFDTRQKWIEAGCDETLVARQRLFNELYMDCVNALALPSEFANESEGELATSMLTDDYQADVRACEAMALQKAESQYFGEVSAGGYPLPSTK